VFVSRLVPFITIAGDGFFVLGSEDTAGTTNSWSITAYALCAPDPGGWELIYGSTLSAPGETDVSAEADCTLNAGKKVIGAGGGVIQDGRNIVLDDVMPLNDLRGVSVELMHDETPVSPDAMYTAFAYAICINALPTQQLVTTMTDAARGDRTAVATCPSFTELHGAGGALSGAYGEAHIDRIGISGAGGISAADIDARTDWNGTTSNWRAWAYAICA
jgi:hypothetical protein